MRMPDHSSGGVTASAGSVTLAAMSEVTRLLDAANRGDKQAAAQLLPLVYDELRRLAAAKLAREKPGQTLNATALVHDAYLRLVGDRRFAGRGHFFAAAAEAMRWILIDRARQRNSRKRGGDLCRLDLDPGALPADPDDRAADDLLALDEALRQLEAEDPAKARLVKLRYFAGLSIRDAADALGISDSTAKRHWIYARSWLYGKLQGR
jgi:RNA polymerase sigma factor (TIGR02999 family)